MGYRFGRQVDGGHAGPLVRPQLLVHFLPRQTVPLRKVNKSILPCTCTYTGRETCVRRRVHLCVDVCNVCATVWCVQIDTHYTTCLFEGHLHMMDHPHFHVRETQKVMPPTPASAKPTLFAYLTVSCVGPRRPRVSVDNPYNPPARAGAPRNVSRTPSPSPKLEPPPRNALARLHILW